MSCCSKPPVSRNAFPAPPSAKALKKPSGQGLKTLDDVRASNLALAPKRFDVVNAVSLASENSAQFGDDALQAPNQM
jgi:hypothetical protein